MTLKSTESAPGTGVPIPSETAFDNSPAKIFYDAPRTVRAALTRIQRTEDLSFSPNNRRLAIAGYERHSIAIVDIDITIGANRPHVTLTGVAEFSSPHLQSPHGVEFLDDETLIVANRFGDVSVLRLPSDESAVDGGELLPIDLPPGRGFDLLSAPSGLAIARDADGDIEVLVCNNIGHTITRHTLQGDPLAVTTNDVLVHRWLKVPDGVAVTADRRWIAISNHHRHIVMLYERPSSLGEGSNPDAVLRGTVSPHGLRFSADGRHLFVADGDRPYVHVYASHDGTWRGAQYPAASIRVWDDDVFERGRRNRSGNGGPKGIDVDPSGHVLAVTSESEQLAFFDVSAILERTADRTLPLGYELEVLETERAIAARFRERIAALEGSASYRVTKPLRRLSAILSRMRR